MTMDLREMFDELATDHEPPTRLTADGAYTAGRRRTRVRAMAGGTVAAAAVAGAVVAVTTLGGSPGGPPAPGGSAGLRPTPVIGARFNGVTWASAADSKHLYASVIRCPDSTLVGSCPQQLLGSDDGGRTWTVRSTTHIPASAYFAGPNTLVGREAAFPTGTGLPNKNTAKLSVSTDGGRSWRDITEGAAPVAAVPAGGFAACGPALDGTRLTCTVDAIDPATRQSAPLATQPSLRTVEPQVEVQSLGGTTAGAAIWVTGSSGDSVTAGLSVAVSRDAGRTWRTTPVDPACVVRSELWHSDGATAKVVCPANKDNTPHAFRTDDYGATWHEVALPRPLPNVNATDEYNLRFTVDGTPLALQFPADESGVRMWTLPDGSASWVRVPATGLAPYAEDIENTPDGRYVAYSGDRDKFSFYLSSDLRTWSAVTIK